MLIRSEQGTDKLCLTTSKGRDLVTRRAPNLPLMATPYYLFLFILTFLCNTHMINSSSCTLNFTKFPYEVNSNCFDMSEASPPPSTIRSCCGSALQSLLRAMSIRTNHSQSQSIFLTQPEAEDCSAAFQNLHRSINFSRCAIRDFIGYSRPNLEDVGSVVNVLGLDRYNKLRSNCSELSESNYSDDACLDCVVSYREMVEVLEDRGGAVDRKGCAKALLVSLASSDVESPTWVHGTSSCLWNEVERSPYASDTRKRVHHLKSKEVIAMIIVVVVMLFVTPILYRITRRQLQHSREKDIENLSVTVHKDTIHHDSIVK